MQGAWFAWAAARGGAVIHIRTCRKRFHNPAEDPMGREWVGWTEELTPQQVYDQNRGVYNFGPRAWRERYAVFSSIVTGTIVAVVEIDEKEPIEVVPGGKKAIRGRVLGPGHPVHDELIGARMPDRHRNPFTYADDPAGLPTTR
jgi:hypothetical protein